LVATVRGDVGSAFLIIPDAREGSDRIELLRSKGPAGRLQGFVHIPVGVEKLHLRLPTATCELEAVTVRRVSLVTSLWRRALPGARSAWRERERLPAIMRRLWVLGRTQGARAILTAVRRSRFRARSYEEWTLAYDEPGTVELASLESVIKQMKSCPVVSLVLLDTNTNPRLLQKTLDSVSSQLYAEWQLCVTGTLSTSPVLDAYSVRLGARLVRAAPHSQRGSFESAIAGLAFATGQLVIFLEPGDRLPPHALFEVVQMFLHNPDLQLLYTDEDSEDSKGRRSNPSFKPEWSPELLRSGLYFGKLVVYRAGLLARVGVINRNATAGFLHGLALLCTRAVGPKQIGHLPLVLCHHPPLPEGPIARFDEVLGPSPAGVREWLADDGIPATVEASAVPGVLRIRYGYATDNAPVTIIIPTRDGLNLLRRCIESIHRQTLGARFEVLVVDNDSRDTATLVYLEQLRRTGVARVLLDRGPFNFSAIINRAVAHVETGMICILNNDVEVISPEWLSEMVNLARQPGVGAVGAKLYYPNSTIQHAGIVVGLFGSAGHLYRHSPRRAAGYNNGLRVVREVAAVTAACLVIRKSLFVEVAGFDEENLPITFSDIDLCLKLHAAGYRNLWTPFAELYHHESMSRGPDDSSANRARSERETQHFLSRWHEVIAADPYYSPNLSLYRDWPEPAWPPRARPTWAKVATGSREEESEH
jgi:GT2 family glycosyltransferase